MATKITKEACLELLRLKARTVGRLPQRADLAPEEVMMIKSYFGPWPRALEAAGLKEPRPVDRLALNREKRARAKERMKAEKMASAEGTVKIKAENDLSGKEVKE